MKKNPNLNFSGLAGMGSSFGTTVRNTGGEETLYIKLKNVITVDGIKQFGWVRVERTDKGYWSETEETGGSGFDPAYEFNQANATLNQIYKAWRDPQTGQLLFF